MNKKRRMASCGIFLIVILVLFILIILTRNTQGAKESIKELMKDAVLHETGKVNLFGLFFVNPSVISAFIITIVLLLFAAIVRIFAIPRFKMVPGKFQLLLESWVSAFDSLAKSNSPERNNFLGLYLFSAGSYIFLCTIFELFGFQTVSSLGQSLSLPAPLSDINAAISMGFMSYFVILSGGIISNKAKGALRTLKDFSLPISMSFRLFGALLSGLLVTELVYYYLALSFVIPVLVAVLFTLLHALIQSYVLCMLTSIFYGEVCQSKKTE